MRDNHDLQAFEPAMPLIDSLLPSPWIPVLAGHPANHQPHIHALYAGDEAVFSIEAGELLDGSLPRRQTRLVQAWR